MACNNTSTLLQFFPYLSWILQTVSTLSTKYLNNLNLPATYLSKSLYQVYLLAAETCPALYTFLKDWSKDRTRNICRHVSSMQKKDIFLSFFTFNNLYACLVMEIVKKHITSTNHVHFNNNAAIVWHAIGWDVAILAYPSFVHKFQYNVQDHYNLKNCNQTF